MNKADSASHVNGDDNLTSDAHDPNQLARTEKHPLERPKDPPKEQKTLA